MIKIILFIFILLSISLARK